MDGVGDETGGQVGEGRKQGVRWRREGTGGYRTALPT